jgi:hypothetical protein
MHYGAFSTTNHVLGSEPGSRLLEHVDRSVAIERAAVMRVPTARFSYLAARSRGLLLAIDSPKGPRTAELVTRARVDLRALARFSARTPRVVALAVDGSLRCVEGDHEGALRCLRESAALAESVDHFFGVGIRYMLAVLEGGEESARVRAQIRAQIEAEGWKSWERGLALRVPGNLALLSA